MKRIAFTVLAALALAIGSSASARADSPIVTGAGSTWSQVAIDQWRADVSRFGLRINYQGVGSSQGRNLFVNGSNIDFAVSEIPFEKDESDALRAKGKSYTYTPIVAGGTSLMYNLRSASGQAITTLRLSSATVTGIFTGAITNWSDQALRAENPGVSLPNQRIIPVVRSDGSGTSAQFSAYMSKMEQAKWCAFARSQNIGCGYTSNYPQFNGSVAQSGSDGVANYVHSESTGKGAITYVEAAYALQRGRPVAFLRNASGNYTLPTSRNVSTALRKAALNADRTQNLDQVYVNPDPVTYAMSSYSYMIAPTNNFPTDKGQVLGKFMIYFACEGQRKADLLGYSPLPPNLVQVVFDAVKQVPGAPAPPPLSQCNNPTITGGSGATTNDTASRLSGGASASGAVSGSGAAVGSGSSGGAGSAGGAGGAGGSSGAEGSGSELGAAGSTGTGATGTGGGAGTYTSGQAQNLQALPRLKVGTTIPTAAPLLAAALIVAILTFGPPVLGSYLDQRKRKSA